MKKLAILGVLALVLGMVCGVLPAQAADSPPNWDICGTWNGWSYYAGTTYNFAMTVTTQNPTTGVFGGTMLYPAYGIIATVTGKVSGDTLTFKRQDNGSTYWAQFSGGVGVTSMSGTWVDIDGKTGPWQASGTATFIPRYDNYMQSLAITSAPTPVVAGDTVTVEAAVRANTDVDVHFEFKGRFSWGDWVYDSKIVSLTSVDRTVTYNPSAILTVPLKAILDAEAETTFYYYVYATLPGDPWSGLVWGETAEVTVQAPPSSAETIQTLIAQLKWEVTNSPLDDGMKTSLLAKLDVASKMVGKAKYKTAYNTLGAFINELQSANAAAVYSDSVPWVNWIAKAQFIQTLLQTQ